MDISNEIVFYEEQRNSAWHRFIFEAFQKVFAAAVLFALSPVLLLVIIAIKLEDPRGSIFYRGKRLGMFGKEFTMFKFRSLKEGAEANIGASLLKKDSDYITRVGRILRLTKLDEIPQFFNVLLGEMNIIGPRPVRPVLAREYEKYVLNYVLRFQVKPGISGPAQVFGDYYSKPDEKLSYEIDYIFKRDMFFDIKIIFITVINISETLEEKIYSLFRFEDRLRIVTLKFQRAANLILFFLGGLI